MCEWEYFVVVVAAFVVAAVVVLERRTNGTPWPRSLRARVCVSMRCLLLASAAIGLSSYG